MAADLLVYDLDKLGIEEPEMLYDCRRTTTPDWCNVHADIGGSWSMVK